jgi:hypothetical protein
LLLRTDGALTELSVQNASDLTYQIQRFKRISATASAPRGLNRKDVLGLRVEIRNATGK